MTDGPDRAAVPVVEITSTPAGVVAWARSLWGHRAVLRTLAVKDFKVRYKRASFGVAWSVLLPLVQALVLALVFGRLGLDTPGLDYLGYVLAGVTAWAFASLTFTAATSAVVDGAMLTDKIWFPRALLVLAPVGANLIGLAIGLGIVTTIQLARGELGVAVVLVVPATALLVTLVTGLSLVTSALYVSFRDVRFIVQAATLLLFYTTPILYTSERLGGLAHLLPLNPFAGAVGLFQQAFAGATVSVAQLVGSLAWTAVLLAGGVALHQRRDRLFVDLL